MKILISNDDGVHAPGLVVLASALRKLPILRWLRLIVTVVG